ncbi:MAG: hypothetical protein Ct9H90mP11_06510 [Acidimicrobiales bacterium]|nr:MAG: hypothetical protein Ct9H90mP11_06510 [Acidimicrobiales bacterium]
MTTTRFLKGSASADLPSLLNNGISPNKSPDSINATKDSLPSNERFPIAILPRVTI